jgi:hypothetical protein
MQFSDLQSKNILKKNPWLHRAIVANPKLIEALQASRFSLQKGLLLAAGRGKI